MPNFEKFVETKVFSHQILHTCTKFHGSRFNNKEKSLQVVDPLNGEK